MPDGMSTAAMRAITRFFLLCMTAPLGWAGLSSCGPEADTIVPDVIATHPAAGALWAADRPLEVQFDTWLEPATVEDGRVELTSGELGAAVWVEYDPVGPSLVIHPFVALRPGLGYRLAIDGEGLAPLGGGPGAASIELGFRAGAPVGWQPPPMPSDAEMLALFDRRCGCHGPAPAAFPALTRQALVGVPSHRQPERLLVAPGRPLESQLVLRVLDGYPGVRGQPKVLSDDERRQIVRWVRGL